MEEEEPKLSEGSNERRDLVFVAVSGGCVDIMVNGIGCKGEEGWGRCENEFRDSSAEVGLVGSKVAS